MSRQNSTFRFRGRRYRVQGRITVRHRTYGLLQLLSRRGSASIVRDDCDRGCEERWLVSELGQKTLRELRSLQVLPERLSRQTGQPASACPCRRKRPARRMRATLPGGEPEDTALRPVARA